MEIDSLVTLRAWLDEGRPLGGLRLQDLDLTELARDLTGRDDLAGLVVLGGTVPAELLTHLQGRGAVVFPGDPSAPVDVFRAHLYTSAELYAGLSGPGGYAATPDAGAYRWARDARLSRDAYASLLKATHDDSITDALTEWTDGRRVVGVMGGHDVPRGTREYADAARLGFALADVGLVVATGGGPGAMEAANLGARAPDPQTLEKALARLGRCPSADPDVGAWAGLAFEVLGDLDGAPAAARGSQPAGRPARSLGIPTWFYGGEPPNVFPDAIAKYFSNAVREEGLLARSNAGVVVLPGAAGTVQEVFQLVTRLYYSRGDVPMPPLVLVGARHWTSTFPVWDLVDAMGRGRPMAAVAHLVDNVNEAVEIVARTRLR